MDSNKFFHLYLFLIVAVAMVSCEKDRLKPGVPAFIKIEHIDLETDYQLQGTNSHKITDVWVYADDQSVGVFELPAVVPVLKNGNTKLRLEAGIKLNGITTTRSNSPFFEPVILDPFNFIPDSIVLINPTVTYRPTTEFVWFEDFEGSSISIDTVNLLSSVNIEKTEMGDAFEGNYAGVINLTSENNTFEAASFEAFVLPTGGRPVFLELNYKNDYTFSVGIFAQSSGGIIKKEIIFLVPQENWNKIYINLTDRLTDSPNAVDFKIFFRTVLSEQHESAEIYLDNIKVMYR